ncbi:hypothetical protein BDV28DRAFT_155258 [Aspergillus coremiiformis]|uniref:Uncharacterized protein n=1 Tax=Aspergillus coremiiformis TaxID=138285 RepID=A0A5N6ZDD0_9EURO|nr:hypothetical protein BDV28DRAFT_155258 [Aspergillus coremiiformis]
MASIKDSKLSRHDPPGNLSDLNDSNKAKWSTDYISYWMRGEINADPHVVSKGRTKLAQFFDGTQTPFNQNDPPQVVEWNAFPKLIKSSYPGEPLHWQMADLSRVAQDEYLEWSVSRGARKYTGDIHSVTFTCEGPEYWQFLASCQKADFLNLMKHLNSGFSEDMDDSDFFLKDQVTGNKVYNPANTWNMLSKTGTIAHLIQPNNTLSAEIDILAQATVIRKNQAGQIITDSDELIKCSKYGNPGRNSDPTIGSTINSFARAGATLTVAEPVALYIRRFDTSPFVFDINSTSDNTPPKSEDLKPIDKPEEVFHWQRGDISKKKGLRIKIEVPQGRKGKHGQQLLVSNIYDKEKQVHIRYGAQFADYFTIGVSAAGKAGKPATAQDCYKPPAAAGVTPCAQFDGFAHPGLCGAPGSSRA